MSYHSNSTYIICSPPINKKIFTVIFYTWRASCAAVVACMKIVCDCVVWNQQDTKRASIGFKFWVKCVPGRKHTMSESLGKDKINVRQYGIQLGWVSLLLMDAGKGLRYENITLSCKLLQMETSKEYRVVYDFKGWRYLARSGWSCSKCGLNVLFSTVVHYPCNMLVWKWSNTRGILSALHTDCLVRQDISRHSAECAPMRFQLQVG